MAAPKATLATSPAGRAASLGKAAASEGDMVEKRPSGAARAGGGVALLGLKPGPSLGRRPVVAQ